MEISPVSPVFVGRETELAELTRTIGVADAGTPQAVIVRGEAGVGKTRLIEELLRSLSGTEAVAAVGGCVEVGGEALPFAPFAEALRTLARLLPDEIREAGKGQEEVLARIVPDLSEHGAGPGRDGDMARLFELTARILERLASRRLVVLVIEDLHWADASTRNLLGYLLRTRRTGRLMIIATYRSDDVHRRHPLLPLLAEVERQRSVRRLEVARLNRVEVTKQLAGILGVIPDPALLNEVFERSDGNAFFVEELARSYAERSGGLEDLRELLLIRVEALPPDGQHIVRIAAESISTAGYALLKATADLPEDRLIEGLRSAVLARVLVPTPDGSGYDFRHSLMREAVSDSLLPGERSLINRRYAEALEADPTLVRAEEVATRLARHWYHAHDNEKALRMGVLASLEAEKRYAYAEQLSFLHWVMELWDRVPATARDDLPALSEPDAYPHGEPYVDVLAAASVAARRSGELDRSLHLIDGALPLLAADPLRAAWFWTRRSGVTQDLNRGDGWTELATAQELVAGLPPSAVHADLLVQIADWGARHRPGPESRAAAERAVAYAAGMGDEERELNARITRAWLNSETDIDGTGLAELYAVRQRAEELGAIGLVARANHNLPSILEGMGRSAEAVRAARHGVEVCRTLGLAETESWVHANMSLSLFTLGRWAESDAALDQAAAVAQSYKARGVVAARRSHILMLRGEPAAAETEMAMARRLLAAQDLQPQMLVSLAQYTMELAALRGRRDDARAEFRRADAAGLTAGPVRYALPMLIAAAAIEADAPDAGTPAIIAAVRAAAAGLPIVLPVNLALAKLLDAELARATGHDDPGSWQDAVEAISRLEHPYALTLAHRGFARALLDTQRRRGEAAEQLAAAGRIADRLGARILSRDIEALARRAGVAEAPASLGLTPRESTVLRLIASGYSNRRIAEELFISEKTAGTHVSHILAKLGASGRTEAAAIAHRMGVLT
ncbi:helix-turn-helix transcriptional regulator [Actinoplanes sp. TBRC 11911]|uniref:helix-turn-helix transcriptional regulator n=1 Tax=Actinoplanes sp. TBRC 11911 TaxID=2729386 RepID=UPI001B7D7250|nr:helix-turn-helix transcriptional regulator [Actinoplanes sp. TBRC 11911]